MAVNNTQKMKRKVRSSKKWKDFRHLKNVEQKGIDIITLGKLRKGCNLHHKLLTSIEEEYEDFNNTENFVMLNKKTHDFVHWIFEYYKKDKNILARIENLLDEMLRINGFEKEEIDVNDFYIEELLNN